MTNLILTTIGIVLAAISAMIAFDYGGDYFLEGYNRAQATSLSNAGNNVSAAYSIYGVQRRRAPANLRELTTSPQGRSLLKRMPEVQNLGTVREQWVGLSRSGKMQPAFVIESVSPLVCRTLNERLNGFEEDAPIPGEAAFSSGCFSYNGTTVNVYYSYLSGAPGGGTVAPYAPITDGWNGEVDEAGGGGGYIPGLPAPTGTPAPSPSPTQAPLGQCGDWLPRYSNKSNTAGFRVEGASLAALLEASSRYCASKEGSKSCEFYKGGDDWGVAYSFNDNQIFETTDVNAANRYAALCNGATMPPPPPTPTPTPTPTDIPGVESCSSGGQVGTETQVDPNGIVSAVLPSSMCRGDYVESPGGRFRLTMGSDGNLVLSTQDGTVMWNTGTAGSDVQRLDVQSDGNAVLYNVSNNPRWSTGTNGQRGNMRLSSDGNLAVYNQAGSGIVWQTRTDICLPASRSAGTGSGSYGRPGTVVPTRLCNNEYVISPDGRFKLEMQSDGNITLKTGDAFNEMLWQSGTSNSYIMNVQTDGNVVGYARTGSPMWATGTNGWSNARMLVETNGNVTVWSSDGTRLLWESRSDRCLPTRVGDGSRRGDYERDGTVVPTNLCNGEFVESPNGAFRFSLDQNGALTLRRAAADGGFPNVVWTTGASSAYRLETQGNGNVRLLNRSVETTWQTGTWDRNGARMSVQDDGNIVVRSANNATLLWQSRSIYCTPAEKSLGIRNGDYGVQGREVYDRLCWNEYTTSPNGRFRLTMGEDGRLTLVATADPSKPIWQSGGDTAYAFFRQSNGNWRAEDRSGNTTWQTGTWDRNDARMMVQDDGNLVVRNAANTSLLWETRSVYCLPAEKGVGTVVGGYSVKGTFVSDRLCSNEYVTSPNGRFRLTMTPNGYATLGMGPDYSEIIWQSGGNDAYALFREWNGNWRTMSRGNGVVWQTGTWDRTGARLIVQDDGNLVVRSADNTQLYWETRTDRCLPEEVNGGVGVDDQGRVGTYVASRLCNGNYLTSPNGRFRMTMRPDGILSVDMSTGTPGVYDERIWSVNGGEGTYKLQVEGNGNVRLVDRGNGTRWETQTWDNGGARLMLNDVGALVVMRTNNTLRWENYADRCPARGISAGIETSPQGMPATRKPFILCQNEYVDSPNGRFRLTLNAQGNLQVLDGVEHDIVLWSSNTNDPGLFRFYSWGDGNHWMMNRSGQNAWQTRTWDNSGARMLVQDDGNVVIYNGTRLLWQTGTGGKTGPSPGSIADLALKLRTAGTKAVNGARPNVKIPATLEDVGMTAADLPEFGEFKYFWDAGEQLNFEVILSGDKAEQICSRIAADTGGTIEDTSRESTASEGCARFRTGLYYWRRVDDAQAAVQSQFIRSFGAAVLDGAKNVTAQPTSLAAVGMSGAQMHNLLNTPGFGKAGENWQFYIRVASGAACRAVDAAVGNPSRPINRNEGFSYTLAEGCGGEGGVYYYFRNVNPAYDQAIAAKVIAAGNGAAAAAMANGGETTSTGRAAAASFLSNAASGYGFITKSGVYEAGEHYTGEIQIASGAACRIIDAKVGNGDRGANMTYEPINLLQGCGRYSDGTYWFWKRLDQSYSPGTVFDAKEMFSADANDDPNGIWNYLEGSPSGGADQLMMVKNGCAYGPCVRSATPYGQVGSPAQSGMQGNTTLDASTLLMHPGADRDAILRFRAPVAGWYKVQGTVKLADSQASGINVNWGQGHVVMNRATPAYSFDYNRRLQEGETISFRLDRAGTDAADSTNVTAKLTYVGTEAPEQPAATTGHRFWRVLAYRSISAADLVSVGEIELRGSAGGADLTDGAGGTALSSSVWGGGHEAFRAFNNDLNDKWASVSTYAGNINQWIGYDFGAGKAVDVKEVAWKVRRDCCIEQTIGSGAVQWSDDGVSWQTSYTFNGKPSVTYGETVILAPLAASAEPANAHRYWRVRGYAANDPYMRASEIEMRETPTGPNVARFGIPMASNWYSGGYDPVYVFNGTTGGNAWATAGGLGWIGVDLLVPRSINEFRYASAEGPKAPTDFALEWSDDAVNWTQAWRTQYSAWGNTEFRTFSKPAADAPQPGPVMATSVLLTGNIRDACMQISELEAYSGGVNVALASSGATVSSSPPYNASVPASSAIDGQKPPASSDMFHSQCTANDYLVVTFSKAFPISELVVYGRNDSLRSRDYFAFKVINGTQEVATGFLDATQTGTARVNIERVP